MADYIVKDTELTSVANAIRTAGGTSSLLTFPNGFANAINNISGGGGGSSDFSTAEVTVVNTMPFSAEPTRLSVPTIDPPSTIMMSIFNSRPDITSKRTDNILVVLYKDGTLIDISEFDASTEFAVSGDAELLSRPVKGIRIFGDCTITISGGK